MPNRHENLTSLFSDIAASIKAKTGSSDAIVADNFDTAIDAIITDPTTDATINSNSQLLNGVTAYGKGVKYTGNIPSRSKSDITVAANTATIPSGHYANSATVTASELASGTKTVTATTSTKTGIDVIGYHDLIVNPTPSETKTATPTVNGFDVNPTSGKLLSKVTVAAIPVTQTENAQGGITYTIAGV